MAKIYYDPDTFELSDKPKNYHGLTLPDGFVPWFGGEIPKDAYGNIKIIHRADLEQSRPEMFTGTDACGDGLRWSHIGWEADIIAYRPNTYIPIPEGFTKHTPASTDGVPEGLHENDILDVILGSGGKGFTGKARTYCWKCGVKENEIIAYKVVEKYIAPVVKGCYVVTDDKLYNGPYYVYKVSDNLASCLDEYADRVHLFNKDRLTVVKGA